MNGHYDYHLQLLSFRNIDLPLQGVYFLQFKFENVSRSTVIIPYGTGSSDSQSNPLHALFPPQIAIDDAMQTTGFVVQYSDEEVALSDSFRVSRKEPIQVIGDDGRVVVRTGLSAPDKGPTLSVDLLFSNAQDVGGLEKILNSPESAQFPTEFTVVASQSIVLGCPCTSQYFRSPLALLREHDSEEDAAHERDSGEIFPCAFVEGLILSSLTKMELPGKGPSMYITEKSAELAVHPMDIEESVLVFLRTVSEYQGSLILDLDIRIPIPVPHGEGSGESTNQFTASVEKYSQDLFLRWNSIVNNFPKRIRKGRFKNEWRNALVDNARKYTTAGLTGGLLDREIPTGRESLLFPLERLKIPVLRSDNISPLSSSGRSHGTNLIILVHGYQGTTNDVRVIRNTIACLCPEAMVLSSSANEEQTDGDIESMGVRLSMEILAFLSKHSSSFSIINRISFVSHSLGGLIVRAALQLMAEHREKFHLFITLSTPHLGVANKLIEGGILLLRLFKRTEVLDQLTLKDSPALADAFLSRLSERVGMGWFKRVVLVGSTQDQYSPLSSSTIQLASDDTVGTVLAGKLMRHVIPERIVRIDVRFDIMNSPSIDTVIGRAAHIKFLESPALIQLLFLSNCDLLDM